MFIIGNIPVRKSRRINTERPKIETKFLYNIMLGEREKGFKTRQILSDYCAARNVALEMIRRKNNSINKKNEYVSSSEIVLFTEISPDCWTDGNEYLRIKVSEIKYS